MGEIYHLSHFFEFLCGTYFGGFALLGFVQDSAVERFQGLIKSREDKIVRSKVLVEEYFKFKIKSLNTDNPFKLFAYVFIWCAIKLLSLLGALFFWIANFFITRIVKNKEKLFLRKFFPSFFFAGCYCLALVLLTAFQNFNSLTACGKAIDFFVVYYSLAALLFQVWGLVVFPLLVNRLKYEHLIFITLIFCGWEFYYVLHHSTDSNLFFDLNWILAKRSHEKLALLLVCVASIPLVFVLFFILLTIFTWELSTIFYSLSIFIFDKPDELTKVVEDIS